MVGWKRQDPGIYRNKELNWLIISLRASARIKKYRTVSNESSFEENWCIFWCHIGTVASDRRQNLIKSSWLNRGEIDFVLYFEFPKNHLARYWYSTRETFEVMSWASSSIFFTLFVQSFFVQYGIQIECEKKVKLLMIIAIPLHTQQHAFESRQLTQ